MFIEELLTFPMFTEANKKQITFNVTKYHSNQLVITIQNLCNYIVHWIKVKQKRIAESLGGMKLNYIEKIAKINIFIPEPREMKI